MCTPMAAVFACGGCGVNPHPSTDAERPADNAPLGDSGTITHERWNNIKGEAVNLVPYSAAPDVTLKLKNLQMPDDVGQDFAARMRGYLTAPTTGAYTFWISCDDNGEQITTGWYFAESTAQYEHWKILVVMPIAFAAIAVVNADTVVEQRSVGLHNFVHFAEQISKLVHQPARNDPVAGGYWPSSMPSPVMTLSFERTGAKALRKVGSV